MRIGHQLSSVFGGLFLVVLHRTRLPGGIGGGDVKLLSILSITLRFGAYLIHHPLGQFFCGFVFPARPPDKSQLLATETAIRPILVRGCCAGALRTGTVNPLVSRQHKQHNAFGRRFDPPIYVALSGT